VSIIWNCTAAAIEAAWWANLQIAPLEAAKDLWETSQLPSNHQAQEAAAVNPGDVPVGST
jgi:hypothetical protein